MKKTLMIFTASWCEQCTAQLEALATVKDIADMPIAVMDVDKYPHLEEEYGVLKLPTFIAVQGAQLEVVKVVTGVHSLSELEQKFGE